MLARLPAPANSLTDHLFVGTDQYNYFTLSWNAEKNDIQTARAYQDISDPASREAQTEPRCLIDPSGRFMTLEIYEGIIVVIPIIEASKRKGRISHAAAQGDAPQVGDWVIRLPRGLMSCCSIVGVSAFRVKYTMAGAFV